MPTVTFKRPQKAAKQPVATRERIEHLSQPKQPRTIWIRTLGKRVFWGDQESLWPLSRAALSANATPRVAELSAPKRNFQESKNNAEFLYSCGRESVIWKVPPGATNAEPTPRIQDLAKPKNVNAGFLEDRPHYVFSCGRSSPIWGVTDDSQRYASSEHIFRLAHPKDVHPQYQGSRGVETIIPQPALKANATPRLESLATAKVRPEGPYRDPIWPVSDDAQKATASRRLIELARPKELSDSYRPARPSDWRVSRPARNARASARVDELSHAIVRASMDHVQFNPDAFLVSPTALKARCSARTQQLAMPLQRD